MKIPKYSSFKYYQENKKRLQTKLVKNFQVFGKKKKQQYGCEQYKNLSEDEKKSWLSLEKSIIK